MNKLAPMEWAAAAIVALLLLVGLASLALTYFVFLRVPLAFGVCAEDRWALEQCRIIGIRAFFIALTSGFFIGIILPTTYTWIRDRRPRVSRPSGAEPGAPPNVGPAESLSSSGVGGGPPSVS